MAWEQVIEREQRSLHRTAQRRDDHELRRERSSERLRSVALLATDGGERWVEELGEHVRTSLGVLTRRVELLAELAVEVTQ